MRIDEVEIGVRYGLSHSSYKKAEEQAVEVEAIDIVHHAQVTRGWSGRGTRMVRRVKIRNVETGKESTTEAKYLIGKWADVGPLKNALELNRKESEDIEEAALDLTRKMLGDSRCFVRSSYTEDSVSLSIQIYGVENVTKLLDAISCGIQITSED